MPPFIINQWELSFNNQLNYLSSSYSHISQGMPYISVLNSTAILKLCCSRENVVVEKTEQQIFFRRNLIVYANILCIQ
ncbi:hypothetical protein VA88_004516 [Salmonella enterica subsp. enterica serovar Oslo]|nr:hypothetical protein [Salmonella enterica subsp. enterica serovar Oslo]